MAEVATASSTNHDNSTTEEKSQLYNNVVRLYSHTVRDQSMLLFVTTVHGVYTLVFPTLLTAGGGGGVDFAFWERILGLYNISIPMCKEWVYTWHVRCRGDLGIAIPRNCVKRSLFGKWLILINFCRVYTAWFMLFALCKDSTISCTSNPIHLILSDGCSLLKVHGFL